MLEYNFSGRFKLGFDFTFFAVIAIFLFFDESGYGIFSILACFLHEMGHLIVMIIEKKPPTGLCFYGGGIKISFSYHYSLMSLCAGSFVNFLLFLLFYFIPDQTSIYPLIFAVLNLMIGIFNLLPVAYLDGRRILETILAEHLPPERSLAVADIVERVTFPLLIGLVCFLTISHQINFTVIILMIYIFICDRLQR